MAGKYLIRTTSDFAASHIIHGHQGACARLHGHNWKIEIECEAYVLDSIGISIDFKILKTHLREVLDRVEHRHLNDIPPFTHINPTAENLANWLFQELKVLLAPTLAQLKAVIVWETDKSMVRYEE